MSDTQGPEDVQEQWGELMEEMNRSLAESVEQNMQAQAAFMESWADAVASSLPDEEAMTEGFEGYNRAYEVWMDAAERMFERSADAAAGEEVRPEEFRDIWLQSANEAFKEVMGTSAFAASTGQLVETMLGLRRQADEISEETLAQLGLPTSGDVEEVGERLVELERRQQAVDEKLDRVLEEL